MIKSLSVPLLLIMALSRAAMAQVTVQNIEAEGNLAPSHDVSCIALSEAGPMLSPADLSLGALDCFRNGRDQMAGDLMMLMLARGRFDIDRVVDETAHQAVQVLMLNLASAGGMQWPERMGAVFDGLTADGSSEHARVCRELAQMPPPQHSPRYMVQHGMDALLGAKGAALRAEFDAAQSWSRAQIDYLKCKN